MTPFEMYLIIGIIISMLMTTGITVLVILLPYKERKDEQKSIAAKEAAERAEVRSREKDLVSLSHEILLADFARDATAGTETTSYKDLLARAREKAKDLP